MALKLTVGVSRKLGLPGYSSVGASCNVEIELDAGLLQGDLDGFHARVRDAFIACQQAVHDELARLQSQPAVPVAIRGVTVNGHDRHAAPENGQVHIDGDTIRTNGAPLRPIKYATPGQVNLICGLARTLDADLEGLLRDQYHVDHPEELSVVQASKLIDRLKAVGSG